MKNETTTRLSSAQPHFEEYVYSFKQTFPLKISFMQNTTKIR